MGLKVSRILHAGYVFECGGTRIAFDPVFENPFSVNCHAFPAVQFDRTAIRAQRFDAVFISHYHDDHCSFDSLNLLDRETPIHAYCVFDELFGMLRELGFRNVYALELDQTVKVDEFEVTPRRALDADVDSIFHVRAAGLNVLNVVDSWIDDEMLGRLKAAGPWDLILWPFQTMRELEVLAPDRAEPAVRTLPPEWIAQLRDLNPRFVVPSSCQFRFEDWSWANKAFFPITYARFQKEIEASLPAARVVRLNPGVSVALTPAALEAAPPLEWVHPSGEQDVDYEHDPQVLPAPVAGIARHFAPLTPSEAERVRVFLDEGLPEKFRSLDPPEDPYFAEPRLWRLSVYDHAGVATRKTFRLRGAAIEPGPVDRPPDWSTEIPAANLYGALERGESLTSLHIRINGAPFEDLVDDPLLRCLFNGEFGAYQHAQLQRLKNQ